MLSVAAELNSDRVPLELVVALCDTMNILPVVVIAVAAEAMFTPKPVVIASTLGMFIPVPVTTEAIATVSNDPVKVLEAFTLRMLVASVAADINSDNIPAPEAELTPVCSTFNNRPVEVIAVAEEDISTSNPLVADVVPA